MLQDGFYDPRKPVRIYWGDLPHWRQDGALYFVTFRLADSIPQNKLTMWRELREAWRDANPDPSSDELQAFSRDQRRRMERWLDQGYGSCVLRGRDARRVVETTIRRFAGKYYELGDLAIAWNHVHVVIRTAPGIDLTRVLASWKRSTSARLHDLRLSTRSPLLTQTLWQRECFDHIVRNFQSLDRISAYIRRHSDDAASR